MKDRQLWPEGCTCERDVILRTILDAPPEITSGYYGGRKLAERIVETQISLAAVIGMRRIGKTEFYTWLACELYMRYGFKTAWVRNREIEFKKNYESFLNGMKARELIPPEWIVKPSGVYTDTGKAAIKVIDFVYLNTASNMRGGGHPDTYMMIFDEFQPEDLRYPPHPLTSLMSLTQTILSGKSSMCFMLSNFVSLANPYFVGMEIYPRRQDITLFEEKGIAVERCRGYNRAIEDGNPWTRVYKAASYQSYASEAEDGLLELVCPPAKGARARDSLIYSMHGRCYRALSDGRMVYWIRIREPNPSNVMIMTPYQDEVTTIIHPMRLAGYKDMMASGINSGGFRFQDPNTLFDMMSPCYFI